MAISTGGTQRKRRLLIGGNVVLATLIVWALILLVNFLVARTAPAPSDWTRSGQFSLSGRTEKLLENLDQGVVLTALYRVGEMDEEGREQQRRVADLLRRYGDISGKVSYDVIDPLKDTTAKTKLIQRLIQCYSGEAKPHQERVAAFRELAPKILNLLDEERTKIQQLAETAPAIDKNRNIVAIFYRFTRTQNDARMSAEEVNDLIAGGDIPRYSDAVKLIQRVYEAVKADLQVAGEYLSTEGVKIAGLDGAAVEAFKNTPERYKAVAEAVNQELEKFTNLPKLSLEEIYDQVKSRDAKSIVVEAAGKAKVLGFSDVWVASRNRTADPNKVEHDFNGEATVSSAILALTAKERSAVVFVHAGPPSPIRPGFAMMRMTEPPFSSVKDKLEEANFIVEDWDIQATPTPPDVKDAKRKMYVIMPSQPQPQEGPMPPQGGYSPQNLETIRSLLDQGQRMIFLVNLSPMMMGRPYPFVPLLKDQFGVDVDPTKIVIQMMRYRDQQVPNNRIEINRYGRHEITNPIQESALSTAFLSAVPIRLEKKLPENVKVTPLVTLDESKKEYWAEANMLMLMQRSFAEFDDVDTAPPFDLAVAAENTKTGAKAVIFGNDIFAADNVANQVQYVLTAKGIGAIYTNPGNLELFANSAFWLNDNENLIAVGPRRADVPRIENISPVGLQIWQAFLWVVWPILALIAGAVVYLVRR